MEDYGTMMHRKKLKLQKLQEEDERAKKEDLKNAIRAQRKERQRLKEEASKVRQKLDHVKMLAKDLEQNKEFHAAHVKEKDRRFEQRNEPIGDRGMCQFELGSGAEQMYRTHKGRHTRRTAYTTTYSGEKILGPSEFDDQRERQRRTNNALDRRAASSMDAPPDQWWDRYEKRLDGSQVRKPEAVHSGTNEYGQPNRPYNKTFAWSPLQDVFHYHGTSSLPDLEGFKHKHLHRTRHYYDYEGKRYLMDFADWPQHDGFVFCGL